MSDGELHGVLVRTVMRLEEENAVWAQAAKADRDRAEGLELLVVRLEQSLESRGKLIQELSRELLALRKEKSNDPAEVPPVA